MADSLCQSALDALTDVDVPKRHPARTAQGSIEAEGLRLPVYACDALVLGGGAAGWRVAVELKRYGIDDVVATQNLYSGTSACSGSDKQTLHTAATGRHGDDFIALAAAQKRTSCLSSGSTGPSVLRSYGFNLTRNCESRAIGLLQCSSKRFPTRCPKTISAKDDLVSGTVVAGASCYTDVRQSLLVGRKLGPLPLTVCIRLVRIAPCVAC